MALDKGANKYIILLGSVDMDGQSLATCTPDCQDVKFMRGDFNDVAKFMKAEGIQTFDEAISRTRELLEEGKPAAMQFVKI